MTIDKERLMKTVGDVTWFWGADFFIETNIGNFHWSDPDYNGDNTIRPFDGTIKDFCKKMNVSHGRDKGKKLISAYCGDKFTLVLPKNPQPEKSVAPSE